jgi:predicted nucleic acid-binding protein
MESYKIKKVLVDTVFIVSFLLDTENNHSRALELSKKLQGKELVITNALLIETMNLLIKKLNKNTKSILKAYKLIKNNFTIVYVDEELTERSMRTLVKYKFKLGLADSLSIEVMKDLHIYEIFSFDKHFDNKENIVRIH